MDGWMDVLVNVLVNEELTTEEFVADLIDVDLVVL
tara:strand:+ start:1103 stop:1207 length:105 start_codon:yes stop_codon:yes gene_type:complete